ncbi:plus-3 domain-containing protein [Wolffia australiana]
MADLENLLLEAAGRTGHSGRTNRSRKSRRRREGSYSDDDSERNDNSNNPGYKGRKKSSGAQIPLKKRLDPGERDGRSSRLDNGDDEDEDDCEDRRSGDENDSDSAPSVGSDLYKDEEDRENLANMTELDREMILTERSIKRDDYQLKKKARATSSKKDNKSRKRTPPLPRTGRSSTKSAAKDDALNEILAKRMKQHDSEGHSRRLRDPAGGTESNRDSSPPKRKIPHPASPSPSSSSSESQGLPRRDSLSVSAPKQLPDSDEDEQSNSGSDSEPLDFDDVKQITIRRSKLAKLFMEPFFEDLIVGCFVRVGIRRTRSGTSLYRLCLVLNVDASDPDRLYKFENRSTYKYLNCAWGAESNSARWQMAMISDSPPAPEEFKALVKETSRAGGKMPTREEVMRKKEAIEKIGSFVYSAATVKQMLMEKKSAAARPTNVAAEKDRLRKEMEAAEARGDEAEMGRIRDRLKRLSEMGKIKDSKAARLAEMNKRNREENFRNLSERRPDNSKVGEAGYDPFSRRWTRSRNYYAADSTATEEAVAEQEAAAEEGKLVDTVAPTDRGKEASQLHDFELPISLAGLQRFGGAMGAQAGYMARRQRIEATMGVRLPENDGRRHPLTLTVSDYKRRRGLL